MTSILTICVLVQNIFGVKVQILTPFLELFLLSLSLIAVTFKRPFLNLVILPEDFGVL